MTRICYFCDILNNFFRISVLYKSPSWTSRPGLLMIATGVNGYEAGSTFARGKELLDCVYQLALN